MNKIVIRLIVIFFIVMGVAPLLYSQNEYNIRIWLSKSKKALVFINDTSLVNRESRYCKLQDSIRIYPKGFVCLQEQNGPNFTLVSDTIYKGVIQDVINKHNLEPIKKVGGEIGGTSYGDMTVADLFGRSGLVKDTLTNVDLFSDSIRICNNANEKLYYYLVYQNNEGIFYNSESYAVQTKNCRIIKRPNAEWIWLFAVKHRNDPIEKAMVMDNAIYLGNSDDEYNDD